MIVHGEHSLRDFKVEVCSDKNNAGYIYKKLNSTAQKYSTTDKRSLSDSTSMQILSSLTLWTIFKQ